MNFESLAFRGSSGNEPSTPRSMQRFHSPCRQNGCGDSAAFYNPRSECDPSRGKPKMQRHAKARLGCVSAIVGAVLVMSSAPAASETNATQAQTQKIEART